MICKLCGQQTADDREYCPNCGAKMEASPVPAYEPAPAQTYVPDSAQAYGYQPNPAQYQPQGYQPNPAQYQPQGYQPDPAQYQAQGYQPNPNQYQAQGYQPAPNQYQAQGYQPAPNQYQPQGYQPAPNQYQPQGYQQNPNQYQSQGYQPAPNQYQPQGYQPYPAYGAAPAAPKVRGTTGFSALGSNMVLFFITVGLMVMNIIFMYCPTISVSLSSRYSSYGYTFGLYSGNMYDFDSDAGYMVVIGIIILLGYIGSIVLTMLPIMANKKWSGKFFLCGRIANLLAISVYLLFVIILLSSASYYMDVGMSFWGWMYLLTSIGSTVLYFLTPNLICKGVAKAQTPPAYNMPMQ